MKRFCIAVILTLAVMAANAYQMYTPAGSADTVVSVNPADGKYQLKQDLIDSPNSGQAKRSFKVVFGRNSAVQNVRCDVWEGPTCVYVFPAAPQQMSVVSSSASDAAAGTGVRTVALDYLDTNYIARTTTLTLNGTTAVTTTTTDILRVTRIRSLTVGSNGTAVGVVSVKNTALTVTYNLIPVGFVSSRQAIYTVPAGYTMYVSHWQASSGAATGSHFTVISLRSTQFSNIAATPGVFASFDELGSLNNGYAITLPIPVRVVATSDIKISAVSDSGSANAIVAGAIMGWLEAD